MTNWDVPRADLAAQYAALKEDIDAALMDMAARAELIGGPTLARFEAAVAERVGVQFAIGTSSGTSALQLALAAVSVGPGAEVIVPAFTFAATAAAVVHCGATPVFADVREDDMCLDPDDVVRLLSPRTRAIVPVHLFGRMAGMTALAQHGLPIIEDAAQALGAEGGAGRAGAVGRCGCFSFHPSKNLGLLGDGGMVTTDDERIAAEIRSRGNHGRDAGGRHQTAGFNHRLDALQAAVGLVKLPHLDRWNAQRRALALAYERGLAGIDLVRPALVEGHVFHQYAVMTDARDALAEHLAADRIGTGKFYLRPVYQEPGFAQFAPGQGCPVAERLARRTLCLPMFPELKDAQQKKVLASIRRFFGSEDASVGEEEEQP